MLRGALVARNTRLVELIVIFAAGILMRRGSRGARFMEIRIHIRED